MRTRRRHSPQMLLPFAQQPIRLRLKLRPYWEEAAERLGAESVELAILRAYREAGSLSAASKALGFSVTTVKEKLMLLGEPRRPRGGANNPYGRAGKPGREFWHE